MSCLARDHARSPRPSIFVPTRRRARGNVSSSDVQGPICWLCGNPTYNPPDSANVHKFCASSKIGVTRSAHRKWFQSSHEQEASLIRVARSWMGPNWKGVLG